MRRRLKKFLKNSIVSWFFYIITWIYLLIMFVSISLQQLLNSDDAYLASVVINYIELFLLACLILEFLMAAYTQGFCNYFKVKLQVLDFIIIFLTLALVILDLLLGKSPQFTKIAAVAKGMFRFFRIILLFRKSNQFKKIKAASTIKTPAERIIDIFTDLKEFFDSKDIIEDIEWSISVIALNKIYETKIVIQGAENNKEIVDWINYGARQKEEQDKQFDQDILSNKNIDTKLQTYVNQIPQPILKYFKDVNELSFDCFEVEKIAKGSETSFLLLYLFQSNNILASVDIEPDILFNFFKQIEKGYNDNLYHNRLHAFDVLQTANFFLKSCNFIEIAAINEFDLCTIYISAACHDYDHPGVNNAFIINTSHEIALTYNDQSVLENHHASKTFQLFNDQNLDITANFTKEQYRSFREMVISIILSTDMAKHFSDIAKLKSRLGTDDYDIKGKDKQMCIDTIIHACDVSNPVKTWNVYQQWAHRVLSEFWSQGDQERSQGIQITYLCDRYTTNTAKSQVGFIDFIVKPLYEVICNFLPELKNYMQQIDSNKQKWNELVSFYDQDLERIKNQIQQLQQSKII
ncbi:3'5'-cyclic nucleotide phosphodiesterase family protein (macronuclear) [Tetrahymena thermophila SB210]|uniref:Phosphodiesterase n=1 Tax=Tetrahymena thermophila (strain SB210) TaxID=312017 RepID=I7M9B7_TETTS|nr:3'5'-cyclic nucleotide phosphodiesterase family protein [Tetrahymena thermophila SB210]EAS01283.2 3'5'-cyclic nucleotide phosphodiesterase family protein [Tetrahymena thermophila SB210]|eukprot:XP_001021528.2 3'5'-cyclic nucleotide phosphodiesterase family protein [Tetrahymena thermophila SB210]